MPSLSKLEDAANRATSAIIDNAEKEAQRVLAQALKEVRGIMAGYYEKYAVKGKLTYAQMTKYNRMVNLETEIVGAINPALSKTRNLMDRLPPDAYNESFFRYAWAVDASQGVRLKWGTLNLDAINKANENPFDWVSREQWTVDARFAMRKAILKGMPIGKSYMDMSADLKKTLETTAYKALRIIRTETQSAINAGQNEAYKRAVENGVEGEYVWDATIDDRTRPSHGAKDQEIRDEKTGLFTPLAGIAPRYPADENLPAGERIQCRCRLRFQVAGYSPLLRRTREDGIIPYQNYTEYAKKYHPEWLK